MPNNTENNNTNIETVNDSDDTQAISTSQPSETVTAHLMQIMGNNRYKPTESQVDKMLALQEKGMDYSFQERTKFTAPIVSKLVIIVIGFVFVGGLFVYTATYLPEYIDVVLAALISFGTGSVGGYGFGTRKISNSERD